MFEPVTDSKTHHNKLSVYWQPNA